MQLQVEYLKRDKVLVVRNKSGAIGILFYLPEGEQTDWVPDPEKISDLTAKRDLKALYGFPVSIQSRDRAESIRDTYLYRVGKLLRDRDIVFLNLSGRSSVLSGLTVELGVENNMPFIKVISPQGALFFLPPVPLAESKGIVLPADAIVVAGAGYTLGGISNILEAKLVLILEDAQRFIEAVGISEISQRPRISLNLEKLRTQESTEVLTMY